MKSGRRDIDPDVACQFVEYMTGKDESVHFLGEWKNTRVLVQWLRAANLESKRVASQPRLPPDWDRDGGWRITEHTRDAMKLSHFSDPKKCVDVFPDMADDDFLQAGVPMNYSKLRASLSDSTDTKAAPCIDLMGVVDVFETSDGEDGAKPLQTPESKKRRRVMTQPVGVGAHRSELGEEAPPEKTSAQGQKGQGVKQEDPAHHN